MNPTLVGLCLLSLVNSTGLQNSSLQALLTKGEDVTYNKGEWNFQCSIERGIIYSFNDIQIISGLTLAKCCEVCSQISHLTKQACWDNDKCVLWSWVNNTCSIKDEQEGDATTKEGVKQKTKGSPFQEQ